MAVLDGEAEGPFDKVPETLDTQGAPVGHILVLDADVTAGPVIRNILAGDGHRVTYSSDLGQGIHQVELEKPDVVLFDPFGAEFGGFKAMDYLRSESPRSGPSIIICSHRADAETAVTALHRGATDYVVKPIDSDRVRLAVVRALDKRRLVDENTRLRRDLALYEAGRRLLETLDIDQLAERGIDVMTGFSGASAALIRGQDGILAHRGMGPDEVAAIAHLSSKTHLSANFHPASLSPSLGRFDEAIALELSDDREVLLFVTGGGFSETASEDALFLARHLATAYKNVARYTSAERRARRDPLTGLLNARAFEEAVIHQVVRAQVEGRPFSVLFMDLDHFKAVNDRYGHLDGSQLLVELSHVIVRSLREGALVGRFGGDEFVVLLPGLDTYAAARVAERLRERVASHAFLTREGLGVKLTACLGVASYPEHGACAQAILDMADKAMYLGKAAARDAVHVAELAEAKTAQPAGDERAPRGVRR